MAKEPEKTTDKKQEAQSEEALVTKCKLLADQAREMRRKYDWEWLVRLMYIRGYHFARYNRGTNAVVFATRTGVRIPVNLVAAHLRGVRNQVTNFQPKWEVLPKVTAETAFENARYSGKVLDYVYEKAQIKRKIKESVTRSLVNSIGIWYFDLDFDKNIVISDVDPFDFYVDPNCKSPNLSDYDYGANYVVWEHQMPLDLVRKNPNYKNTDELKSDNKTASAEYKQFLQQIVRQTANLKYDENKTLILKEMWLREIQEDGTIKLRFITYADNMSRPLQNILLDTDEYPFEVLQGDINPGELYGESWVKHLIPINRVIDALESHVFEYNHFFAKGRFVVDKNSGVRVIVNQHGQIIEKNRGSTVTSLPISPLPPSPQEQLSNMRRYMEDISGVHDVSLGRLPGTIRSGVAIAELRQSDATNQSDLVDNLEDFLSRSGRKILRLVAENWTTSKLVSTTGLGGKPEYFMAIGEKSSLAKKKKSKYTFGEMELPLAVIGSDNEVRVQVGSWLAYTKEARQEKLKELFRLGAIDQKTYLEYSEFADIDGIVERTREEAMMQAKRGRPSAAVEKQFGVEMDDESLAIAENELMLEGTDQPVHPDDDHEIHAAIHKEHLENDIVRTHYNEHLKMARWNTALATQPASQEVPQGMEGGLPEGLPMEAMMGGGMA